MKNILIVMILMLGSLTSLAQQKFFDEEVVDASQVGSISVNPGDKAWDKVKGKTFKVYPQKTVRLNDKKANEAMEKSVPQDLVVKAMATGSEVGLYLEWSDDTKTLAPKKETNIFGDSVAIEFPENFGDKQRLPYIGMGDEKAPVFVYMQRAAEEKNISNEYVAKGFGSLTRTNESTMKTKMEYDSKAKKWKAVFVRKIKIGGHSLGQALVPVAFAVWDGNKNERGGNKMLSSWKFIKLSKYKVNDAYLKYISWGYNPGDLGNPADGKNLMSGSCVGCHRFADQNVAQDAVAPNLNGIGGIALPVYLKESVMHASDVVIRSLQPNRHYDKSQPQDKFKAYPNNEVYKWYMADDKGNKTSKMPNFDFLSSQDVANIVSYLKTL